MRFPCHRSAEVDEFDEHWGESAYVVAMAVFPALSASALRSRRIGDAAGRLTLEAINQPEAMMFLPQRVLISRQGSNDGDMPGTVVALPHVGESLQMFLDSGRVMRTSPVTHVEDAGSELVVDTQNSRYRLKLAS